MFSYTWAKGLQNSSSQYFSPSSHKSFKNYINTNLVCRFYMRKKLKKTNTHSYFFSFFSENKNMLQFLTLC